MVSCHYRLATGGDSLRPARTKTSGYPGAATHCSTTRSSSDSRGSGSNNSTARSASNRSAATRPQRRGRSLE